MQFHHLLINRQHRSLHICCTKLPIDWILNNWIDPYAFLKSFIEAFIEASIESSVDPLFAVLFPLFTALLQLYFFTKHLGTHKQSEYNSNDDSKSIDSSLTANGTSSKELQDGPLIHLASAVTAGIVTATATNPIWVVKTRIQLQSHESSSMQCLRELLAKEGFPVL